MIVHTILRIGIIRALNEVNLLSLNGLRDAVVLFYILSTDVSKMHYNRIILVFIDTGILWCILYCSI